MRVNWGMNIHQSNMLVGNEAQKRIFLRGIHVPLGFWQDESQVKAGRDWIINIAGIFSNLIRQAAIVL
jgi:hypothetical protein